MPRLCRPLGADLWLIRTSHYPLYRSKSRTQTHHALLGIGGNMGDVLRRFEHLYNFLVKSSFVSLIETSPILRNPPFGYLYQDDFYNATLYIQTSLSASELLRYILYVEKRFGRKRSFANAPRTLDIDMIFYDQRIINTRRLRVPHPHWQERDSVVIPFAYMKGTPWSKRRL